MRAFRPAGLARSRPVVEELNAIARALDRSAAQVALNWLAFSRGETVVAIPGATRPEQARDNARVLGFRLGDEEVERLDRASAGFLDG